MKSPFTLMTLGLLLLAPFATARAQAPALSPIPDITLNAGGSATVNVVAVDTGGRQITLTQALPAFGTLNAPTIGMGVVVTTLTLAPSSIQVGTYTAAVTATAGGVAATQIFQITVNAAGSSRAPVVSAPALQQVTAGSTLGFTVSVSDPDASGITTLSASSLPGSATFTPNGTNTSGAFQWATGLGDAGEYDVQFTATANNGLSGGAVTHIRVASAPQLAIVPISTVTVPDGSSISVPVSASGLPGAAITLTASLPSFATLNPPGSGTGSVNTTITVSPPTGSAGTYHASVTAISGGSSVTAEFDIIVTGSGGATNHPPTVTAPASETVAVGSTLSFDVTASDPDGDPVALSGTALPPGSAFVDHGNDTGTFSWSPASGQEGTYTASFTGLDGRGGSGSASTQITVTGEVAVNHPPTVTAPASEQVNEGVLLSFTVTASDPDGDHVTLTATGVPTGAAFTDQGNDTGLFSWTPDFTQAGAYDVAFAGNDGRGGTGTASTAITVADVAGGGGGGGGGGGEVAGKACLIGHFKAKHDATCFRIRPVNGSFDLRDVVLSSIVLEFQGRSIAVPDGGAQIDLECHRVGPGHGGDDNGQGDDNNKGGDNHQGNDNNQGNQNAAALGRQLSAALRLNGDHPGGDDGERDDVGRCGVSCRDKGGDDDSLGEDDDDQGQEDHGGKDGSTAACDTLGIRACFSTQAVLDLFGDSALPCALLHAEIHAMLANGDTVVATFGDGGHPHDGKGHGDGEDGNAQDKVATALNAKFSPNPLNPRTVLSFQVSRAGRVRVTIYDMQGRLVNTLLDEYRASGPQRLAWDGSNARSVKVASGVYFFRIQAPEGVIIRRVAVVK